MTEENKNKKIPPETTGHEWDGISEYNVPAPRWWLITWIICIIWAVIYWFFFPAWPIPGGNSKGVLHWSKQSQLAEAQAEIDAKKSVYLERISQMNLQEIRQDPKLMEFALNGGRIAFKENCAACHGLDAQGGKGFPNLNDDDWLWGGKLEDIEQTIRYGIRSGHDKARMSQMPAFGLDKILTKDDIDDVVEHVMSLSKPGFANLRGEKIFAVNCASCHGADGRGDRSIGAPSISDKIWLYGGDRPDLLFTVTYSRAGVMPYWVGRLDDNTIKELALYIHALGGGE